MTDIRDKLTSKEIKWLLYQFSDSFEGSVLDDFVNDRLDKNRDVKIIITARNSETGVGKTTLAVKLAKHWDRNGWNASKGFLDIERYLAYYSDRSSHGDVLILDDAEATVDNRQSMSTENRLISKYWSILRVRNVVSILTMPTMSMLDKRLIELSDCVINVRGKGDAVPYRTYVDDVTHDIRQYRWRYPQSGEKFAMMFTKDESEQFRNMERKKNTFVSHEIEDDFDKSIAEILD